MRIGKVEPSGRPVIWTSLKLGPDLTGNPSGSTFPILTMTPWKILFVQTSSEATRVWSSSRLIVNRDSDSPWTLASTKSGRSFVKRMPLYMVYIFLYPTMSLCYFLWHIGLVDRWCLVFMKIFLMCVVLITQSLRLVGRSGSCEPVLLDDIMYSNWPS